MIITNLCVWKEDTFEKESEFFPIWDSMWCLMWMFFKETSGDFFFILVLCVVPFSFACVWSLVVMTYFYHYY